MNTFKLKYYYQTLKLVKTNKILTNLHKKHTPCGHIFFMLFYILVNLLFKLKALA